MYLDELKVLEARVGYGQPGTRGALGYEGKSVRVRGRTYKHAVSAHAPSRLVYHLGRRFSRFRCKVALNDDVPEGRTHADFTLLADGRRVAHESYVRAGEQPRALSAEIRGAERLELVVSTSRWEFCHSLWLNPQVIETPLGKEGHVTTLLDCLLRTEIELPAAPLRAERCVATIVSPGFEGMLDDMLGSLVANGRCDDALIVVFGVEADEQCRRVADKYGAAFVRCSKRARINPTVKSVLYTAARVVDAHHFLCLDADMLVLGDLRPVFGALEACPEGTILACREANNGSLFNNLEHALHSIYAGHDGDIHKLTGRQDNDEGAYPLVVNDGLFAAGRAALLALDGLIREWEHAPAWVDERRDIWWRNQFVFNLALAHMRCGVELDSTYNVQLCWQDATAELGDDGRVCAFSQGKPARVLHFNGDGRSKCQELRGIFARVEEPLVGRGGGDNYVAFIEALRAWVGRHGVSALTWSFYGTTEGLAARVSDPSTLPLLALLHYLIRSQGCVRVLEAGTAHGVSAACLASAVAHRQGGRVVTFDVNDYPRRAAFWATLPEELRACLDFRQTDSREGMRAALAAGETFHAALLDSMHTEEQVWSEFQLAARLVCPGGLILIHDVLTLNSTVEQALRRIEAAGYGVVRLWTAEGGEREDDCLGLAVIENRRKSDAREVRTGETREERAHQEDDS